MIRDTTDLIKDMSSLYVLNTFHSLEPVGNFRDPKRRTLTLSSNIWQGDWICRKRGCQIPNMPNASTSNINKNLRNWIKLNNKIVTLAKKHWGTWLGTEKEEITIKFLKDIWTDMHPNFIGWNLFNFSQPRSES